MKKMLLGVGLITSFTAHAINFNVDITSCPGGAPNQAICDALETDLETQAQKDLPSVSLSKYTVGVSNSVSAAGKDNSDYSDKFDLFAFKYSPIGVGLDGDLSDMDNPESLNGVGFQGTMQIGLNLALLPIDKIGPIDLDKLDVFASVFSLKQKSTSSGTTTDAEISSMGVFARYQLFEGADLLPGYLAEWGGIFVHTGFRQSKMKLGLSQTLDDQAVSSGGIDAKFSNAVASFTMDSSITSIPVEVSTYMRFLYIFTLYGGMGLDIINSGSTDINFSMAGDILNTSDSSDIGDITASEKQSGKADGFTPRAFAGLQFNLPFFRLYVQAQKYIGKDIVGANAGVKILY